MEKAARVSSVYLEVSDNGGGRVMTLASKFSPFCFRYELWTFLLWCWLNGVIVMGLPGISYIISHWPGSVGLHYRAMLSQNNTIFPSLCLSLWEWSMYFYFSEVLTLLTTATECHSPAALWSTWWRKTTTRKIFLARKNFFFLLFEQARKHCVWVGVNVQSQWECEVELSEIVTMSAKLSTLAWLSRLRLASIFSLTDLTEYQQRTTWLDSVASWVQTI